MWDEIGSVRGVTVVAKTDSKMMDRAIKAAKVVGSKRMRM